MTFRLAEVGPWQVAGVGRVDKAPSGFASDFVETPLGVEDPYLNDHVTVECRHEGSRLIAVRVIVTNWPAADTGGLR